MNMMWKTKTTEIGKLRGVEEEIEVGRGSPQLLPDSDYLLSGEPRFEMEDRGQQDSRSHYWLTHFPITLCASNQLGDIGSISSKGSRQLEANLYSEHYLCLFNHLKVVVMLKL